MRKLMIVAFAAMLIAPAFAALSDVATVTGEVVSYMTVAVNDDLVNTFSPEAATTGTLTVTSSSNVAATLTISDPTGIFSSSDWTKAYGFDVGMTDLTESVLAGDTDATDTIYWSLKPDYDVPPTASISGTLKVTIAP